MPEIPDAIVEQQKIESNALHQKIKSIKYGDELLLDSSKQMFGTHLKGRKLTGTKRWGKNLFIQTDKGMWLRIHFGMTGTIKFYEASRPHPDYTQFDLFFENDIHLAYVNKRKFGRLEMIDDVEKYAEEKKIGPDAYDLSKEEFKKLWSEKKGMLKTAFMDQSLMSGIGNIYADEILFQTGWHPEAKVEQLTESDLEELYESMQDVINAAVKVNAYPPDLPNNYLLANRTNGGTCPKCGDEFQKKKVGGRTTYFCENDQKIK